LNTLLENPLPILAVGAMLATLCGLVFLSRRNLPSLFVFLVVVLLTLLLVITERLVVTPREEVEQALATLLAAVESNDLPAVLTRIDPQATQVRSDAETLMPLVRVEDTGATRIEIDLDMGASPPTATSRCLGRLRGIHQATGQQAMFFDQLEFRWVRRDDRWLLATYVATIDGKPLNAVNRLKANRPTPANR
jgi:hypothetical protein